jgi:4-carboxymuconolactone decarboxylase
MLIGHHFTVNDSGNGFTRLVTATSSAGRTTMARLTGVSDSDAGPITRIAFFFTRRKLRKLAGSDKPALLDPLRMYAYLPKVLNAYGRLEQAQSTLEKVLSARHRALAELKAATTVRCEYCIDLGSAIARRWGITDEELLALADYQNAVCFSDVDKLVLDYATAVSRTPVNVSEQLIDDLRAHFGEAALAGHRLTPVPKAPSQFVLWRSGSARWRRRAAKSSCRWH